MSIHQNIECHVFLDKTCFAELCYRVDFSKENELRIIYFCENMCYMEIFIVVNRRDNASSILLMFMHFHVFLCLVSQSYSHERLLNSQTAAR